MAADARANASTPGELYAGFDVGTQGLKGLLTDAAAGRVIARASATYGLIEGLPAGHCEQHPDTWIAALADVARRLFRAPGVDPAQLAGIGVGGQQHGLVVVDAADRPLRAAKLWCDTATTAEALELSSQLGRPIPAGFTASKVLWLARREPELWRRAARVLLPHEYVNLVLTGSAWSEAGDASGSGWFDPVARAVDRAAADAIDPGLAGKLPALIDSNAIGGRLCAAGAAWLGLDARAVGTPLSSGGGDNMMAAIGAGATREGVAVLSLGTSATVFGYSARPCVDPTGVVAPFCDSTGGWLPLLCVMNATGAVEEVRAAFGMTHDELERGAAGLSTQPDGPLFVPFFQGERTPDLPHASAALVGMRSGDLRAERMYRCVLEGVALNLAAGVERLRELGVDCRELRAVGGGARNRLWLQLIADACRARVVALAEPEAAALGAALQVQAAVARASGLPPGGTPPSVDALAQSFVDAQGEPIEPQREGARRMAELGKRFRDAQARLFTPPLRKG